jgi:hypothetical protein
MQYFRIAPGKFIQYDDSTQRAVFVIKSELVAQIDDLKARIGSIDPSVPATNAQWIAWAKAHYPYVDHSAEQAELDKLNIILSAIKDL